MTILQFRHLDHRPAGIGQEYDCLCLKPQLEGLGLTVEVLESDKVRQVITPTPTYSEAERDVFYRALAYTGQRLEAHGVIVVFDATASRRSIGTLRGP